MSKNNSVILEFKDKKTIKDNEISKITIENSNNDLTKILSDLKDIQIKINKCNSIESIEKVVDLEKISDDIGLIIQNTAIINDSDFKKRVEETNQLYRSTEIQYFNKKINLLDSSMKNTFKESENNIKDMTNGTLFSIASVFLGISLTSALVAGVQYVTAEFLILYYVTCLLIAVVTIGLTAIFVRKIDKKSIVITIIIALISILWLAVAISSYNVYIYNQEKNIRIKKVDVCEDNTQSTTKHSEISTSKNK